MSMPPPPPPPPSPPPLLQRLQRASVGDDHEEVSAALHELECLATNVDQAEAMLIRENSLQQTLAPHLKHSDTERASAATRLLTAISSHAAERQLCAKLIAAGLVPVVLERLAFSTDSLSLLLVNLLHNLADSEANRLRLLTSGTLVALTRLVRAPSAPGALKERSVEAAASVAGCPEEEVSFPQILGRLCGSRMPGTQLEALRSLELLSEVQQLREQLGQVPDVVSGLGNAMGSHNRAVAAKALELMKVLKRE